MREAVLEARGLTKRYGARVALDSIDLTVARDESLAIFGANGAGKSTLLGALAGTIRPTAGKVLAEGGSANAAPGYVAHATLLYDDLTARENLVFFARLHGVADPGARAADLLGRAGLAERADDPVRAFSRGMQQRVSLARALVHDPPVLFLDEPFTGLDLAGASAFRDTLAALRGRGRTVVLSSHDLASGLVLTDRWTVLQRGRIASEGRSEGTDPRALEEYLR
jgi:heme exporter protein A